MKVISKTTLEKTGTVIIKKLDKIFEKNHLNTIIEYGKDSVMNTKYGISKVIKSKINGSNITNIDFYNNNNRWLFTLEKSSKDPSYFGACYNTSMKPLVVNGNYSKTLKNFLSVFETNKLLNG